MLTLYARILLCEVVGGSAKFVGSLVGYSVAKRCGDALYDVMFSSLVPVKYLPEKVRCVTTLKTLAPRSRRPQPPHQSGHAHV
jgi:hypothetical protein